MTYGVQYSSFSGNIYAGTISADGTRFTDKEEVTPQVIAALEDKVQHGHDGSAQFVRRERGRKIIVDVEVRIEEES